MNDPPGQLIAPPEARNTGAPKGISVSEAFRTEITISSTERETAPGLPQSKMLCTLPKHITSRSSAPGPAADTG